MAQLGLHGVIGVAVARSATSGGKGAGGDEEKASIKLRQNLCWGIVLGSILPDLDFFLLGPLYLVNAELGLSMHRSFSHSLLIALGLLGFFYFRSRRGQDLPQWALGKGIFYGLLLHIGTDLLIWFSGVNLLWPLGLVGLPSTVNFWAGLNLPPLVPKLLGAFDYFFFALFFFILMRQAQINRTDTEVIPRLQVFIILNVVLFIIYTGIAFSSISVGMFDIAHYAVFILAALPIVLYVVIKMRKTISSFVQ